MPVELYTVFSDPKTLVKNLVKNLGGGAFINRGCRYYIVVCYTSGHSGTPATMGVNQVGSGFSERREKKLSKSFVGK